MATKKSYYGKDKNYSGSVSRWLGYLKKGNKTEPIFQKGIARMNKILDNQIKTAKSREAKFKEEVKFMNDFFEKMDNKEVINNDIASMVIREMNNFTYDPDELHKRTQNSAQYLEKIHAAALEAYLADVAKKSGVKLDKFKTFLKRATTVFNGDYDPQQHYKLLSLLGYAKEEHLTYILNEYLQNYISSNVDEFVNNIIEIIRKGSNSEKVDVAIYKKGSDGTLMTFGISSKLAPERKFSTSGIKFHSEDNSPFILGKIFKVYKITDYSLRRLLVGLIYHSGARMTKKNNKGQTEYIKYQQWYDYNKEFADKLASILASAAIGDNKIGEFANKLKGNNQVDFLYLGNKIIPKSSVLMALRDDNFKTQIKTQFYVSKFSRNFVANGHSFGYYAKTGELGRGNSEVEALCNQLLEKSGLRGITIKYKIKKGGIIK